MKKSYDSKFKSRVALEALRLSPIGWTAFIKPESPERGMLTEVCHQ